MSEERDGSDSSNALSETAAQEPLKITITDAGSMVMEMQNLLRLCVPALRRPYAQSARSRRALAQRIEAAVRSQPDNDEQSESNTDTWIGNDQCVSTPKGQMA